MWTSLPAAAAYLEFIRCHPGVIPGCVLSQSARTQRSPPVRDSQLFLVLLFSNRGKSRWSYRRAGLVIALIDLFIQFYRHFGATTQNNIYQLPPFGPNRRYSGFDGTISVVNLIRALDHIHASTGG